MVDYDFYPAITPSTQTLVIVGGSGDTKEKLTPLALNLKPILPHHNLCTFSFSNPEENNLPAQIPELESIINFLLSHTPTKKIHIFATSMGAYSTCHLLINPKFVPFIRQVILFDPADYYLDQTQDFCWSGADDYLPKAPTNADLLNKIKSQVKIDVVHLTLKNYGPKGYLAKKYRDRGEGHQHGFPRLNTKMVKTFYTNLPPKNRGQYLEFDGIPHGFIRDGKITQNLKKTTQIIDNLLKS
jgi:pimeloyl-ACP methyl ester carboxylesterase